ncbi:hypothetical protein ACIRBX_21950 [Kitasatospora sp. NPDC096147]
MSWTEALGFVTGAVRVRLTVRAKAGNGLLAAGWGLADPLG